MSRVSEEQPEGVDERLEAGVSDTRGRVPEDTQDLAPGADAGADADPRYDEEQFARAVKERAAESGGRTARDERQPD